MSEFEDKSQAELHAMIADANPQDFYDRAGSFADAASHMDQLSQELQQHVNSVEWQGSGGDAFRQWGQQLVNTTSDFATYTNTVSSSLYSVGDSLTTAVAGVRAPLPTPTVPLPGAQPYVNGAMPLADSLQRDESINLMSSLSSSYSTAVTDFKTPPPVFAPMPQAMLPDKRQGTGSQTGIGSGGPGATAGTPGWSGANESGAHAAVTPGSGSDPAHTVTMPGVPHVPSGHTTLDSLPTGPGTTLPTGPTVPGGSPGSAGGTGGRGGLSPVGGLPPYGTGAGDTGGFPQSGLPGERLPGRGSGYPEDDGIVGGAAGGRLGGASRGLVVGDEEPPPRMPGGFGGGGYGSSAGGSYRTPGASRGIGEEGEQYPGSGSAGNRSGAIGASGSGAAAEESGAMRSGMAGGYGGAGTGAGRRARSSGSRPDYVVEDEETWMTGGGTVPPVID